MSHSPLNNDRTGIDLIHSAHEYFQDSYVITLYVTASVWETMSNVMPCAPLF